MGEHFISVNEAIYRVSLATRGHSGATAVCAAVSAVPLGPDGGGDPPAHWQRGKGHVRCVTPHSRVPRHTDFKRMTDRPLRSLLSCGPRTRSCSPQSFVELVLPPPCCSPPILGALFAALRSDAKALIPSLALGGHLLCADHWVGGWKRTMQFPSGICTHQHSPVIGRAE